jgi:uncharacterized protein YjiS (DUF1127 family)
MLMSIVRYLQSWKRYGTAVQELSPLSDRELADIGITRSDIPRIAWEHAQGQARAKERSKERSKESRQTDHSGAQRQRSAAA